MKTYQAAIKLTGNTKFEIITINANSIKEAKVYAKRYGEMDYISKEGSGELFI